MPPSRRLRTATAIAMLPLLSAAAWWGTRTPSLSRQWVAEQSRVPGVSFDGDTVRVQAVRDYRFTADGKVTPAYRTAAYPLSEIRTVWFAVTPFNRSWRGPAHTFLTFGFADGQHVAVSVEARRELGEKYSIWKGLLRQYELTYVIAEERDAIGVRAIGLRDPVYLYPIRATPAQVRDLFVSMMRRAETLEHEPAFYNSLTDNCTTNILDAVNAVAPKRIRYGPRILLSGYADAVAHERGLIDTELPLQEARVRFRVDEKARAAGDAADFSQRIRA